MMPFCREVTGVCYNNFSSLDQKLPQCLWVGYQVCGVYITMLFIEMLFGVCYNNFFSCGKKVTPNFMREFPDSWYINYHALSTNKLSGCVTTIFFLPVKSYHDVCEWGMSFMAYNYHALFTNKLWGCVTAIFFPRVESYNRVCELSGLW